MHICFYGQGIHVSCYFGDLSYVIQNGGHFHLFVGEYFVKYDIFCHIFYDRENI
jgi:hypothetical protein